MAHIKMTYIVQSCPRCNKKLLKVAAGSQLIGSPLLTCKTCGNTYKTDLRVEWYKYPQKWMLVGLPLIITAAMLLVGFLMGEPAVGVMAAIFGLIFGLCFTVKDLIRMINSKKRMRNAEYLAQLLLYGVISPEEYETFMREAQ